jgi:hypothetical protein
MKRPLVLLISLACALVVAGFLALTSGSKAVSPHDDPRLLNVPGAPPASETITVGTSTSAPAVAKGFVGMSIEYQSIAADAGPATDPNRVFDALLANLNPGTRPVVRIGGDSTDHTWYPIRGVSSKGLSFALTPAWLSSVARFAKATDAKLILGINLEANSAKLAAAEARALLNQIGAAHILQWEVGNEPNLYASFPWYVTVPDDAKTGVFVRSRSYSFSDYLNEFHATGAVLPDIPLAGPALGSPVWMANLGQMLRTESDVADVTYHAYPLNCFAAKGNPAYPSIADLLSRTASDGLADGVAPFAKQALAAGRSFRVDELNSSACGGSSGVSDTFASALWVTDTLFAMASKGVSGVNIQDFNSSRYKPFGFSQVNGKWVAQVEPMYYGMQLFSRAAPAGSKLLSVSSTGADAVRAWAARTPTGSSSRGARTVTLINDSASHAETVKVRVPGATGGTLVRMLASGSGSGSGSGNGGVGAKHGISLAGLSYGDSTTTGQPQGREESAAITPAADGTYHVSLPAASAVLLTLPS